MEFRIPLQIKASLNFSNVSHNDPFFYGDKFIKYPDGSVHLHVELVEEKVEKNFQEKNGNLGTFLNVPGSISLDDDSTWLGDDDMSFETSRRSLRSSKSSRSRRSSKSKSSSSRLSASSGRRSLGGFSGGGHSIKSRKTVAGTTMIGNKRKLQKRTNVLTIGGSKNKEVDSL